MLSQHLGGIATVRGQVCSAHVKAQPALHRASACYAFLQHLHANPQVAHRVKRGKVTAKILVLVRVHTRHHLHEALGAHGTLCKRIETRFNGHDGKDQCRIDLGAATDFVGLGHQHGQRLRSHPVLLAQPERHGRLFAGQVLGVAGRGTFAGVGFDGHAQHLDLACLQPVHEVFFSRLAQIGARRQCDGSKCHSKA